MASPDLQMGDTPLPRRAPAYQIVQQVRPRSLVGQISTLLLQPGVFFRTLPVSGASRAWLWVGALILILVGVVAVRQAALAGGTTDGAPVDGGMMPPDMSGGGEIPLDEFGGMPPMDGGMPGDMGAPPADSASGTGDITTTWTTALIAASGVILAWAVVAVLLSEVSLFNGRAPSLGRNLQIAVWASLPLGLMAGLQLLYYAGGGTVGAAGLSGLVTDWSGFSGQTPVAQALLLSLASRLTLFWLWSLLLLYFGARHALKGRWWASVLVVVMWVAVVVIAPVATGAIEAPTTEDVIPLDEGFDPSMMEPGMMPDTSMEQGMDGKPVDPFGSEAVEGDVEAIEGRPMQTGVGG